MTGQEEKQHLLEEIAQLREENTRLKAVSGLSQIPEPSELEVDPLFLKIKQQLIHLQDANIISLKAIGTVGFGGFVLLLLLGQLLT
ncbi:MAG: hypothetical protein AAFQ87_02960, partial [Bacteroidota bacterium]